MKIVCQKEYPKDYYVYLHRKLNNDEIIYVGKGKNDRYKTKNNRSEYWKRIAKKYGIKVEIVQEGLQEWYAYELEQNLVDYYGRKDEGKGSLINLCDGGGLARKFKHTEEHKRKMSILMSETQRDKIAHHLINEITQEEFVGTRQEFLIKYKINISHLFGSKFRYQVVRGWRLKDSVVKRSKSLGINNAKTVVYLFQHENGECFKGTRKEFHEKYNLNLDRLFMNNPRHSLYGWKIVRI